VLDLEPVTSKKVVLLAHKLGVSDRCSYASGDMCKEFFPADVYTIRMIIDDHNIDECVKILTNVHRASQKHGVICLEENIICMKKFAIVINIIALVMIVLIRIKIGHSFKIC